MDLNNLSDLSAPDSASQYAAVKEKITSLKDALLTAHPQMPVLLREIHSLLKNDPAVVTLLAPEEVATIINGLEKQTNTFIAQSMTKTSASKTKALKNVTADDLGF